MRKGLVARRHNLRLLAIVGVGLLAGCNGDEYSGKVRNAEELSECYLKASAAEDEYRKRMNLPTYDDGLDAEQEREFSDAAARMQIALIGFSKAQQMTIAQMVEEAEKRIKLRDGAAFSVSCDVAYITQEKIVWPDL